MVYKVKTCLFLLNIRLLCNSVVSFPLFYVQVDKDATDSDTRQDCRTRPFPADTRPQSVSPSPLQMTGGVYPGLQPDTPENRKPPVVTFQGSPTRKNGEDEMSSGNWQQGKVRKVTVIGCAAWSILSVFPYLKLILVLIFPVKSSPFSLNIDMKIGEPE